jgi:TRAP-type C4-dicarboxylate transport system substrate-binding protein
MQYITPIQKRTGKHIQIFADRNETLSQAGIRLPARWGNRTTRKYIVKNHEVLNPAQKKSLKLKIQASSPMIFVNYKINSSCSYAQSAC